MLIGVIADDLTGATDVALMLKREGMRVVQCAGEPTAGRPLPDADAVVVALKSRTAPVDDVALDSAVCSRFGKSATGGDISNSYGPRARNLNKYLSFSSADPKNSIARQVA